MKETQVKLITLSCHDKRVSSLWKTGLFCFVLHTPIPMNVAHTPTWSLWSSLNHHQSSQHAHPALSQDPFNICQVNYNSLHLGPKSTFSDKFFLRYS